MDELIATCQALGIDTNELGKSFTKWRFETLHVRGVDLLTSEDIYNYFGPIHPHSVEWLSNISCNVTFDSSAQACNALQAVASALIIHKNENPNEAEPSVRIPNLELEVRSSDSLEIPVPPNYRYILGSKHEKAKSIIIRFATVDDKKIISTGGPVRPEAILTDTTLNSRENFGSARMDVDDGDDREEEGVIRRSFNRSRLNNENPRSASLRMRMHADEEERKSKKPTRSRTAAMSRGSVLDRLGDSGPRIIRPGRDVPLMSRLGSHHQQQQQRPSSVVKSKHQIWRRSITSNGRPLPSAGGDLRAKLASKNANVRVRVSYDEDYL